MKVALCLVVLIAVLATSDAILLKKLIAFKAGLGIGAGLGAIKGGLVGKALGSGGYHAGQVGHNNGYASNYNHGGHAQVYKVVSVDHDHGGAYSNGGWSNGGQSSGGWSNGGQSSGGWSNGGGHSSDGWSSGGGHQNHNDHIQVYKVVSESSGHGGWSNGGGHSNDGYDGWSSGGGHSSDGWSSGGYDSGHNSGGWSSGSGQIKVYKVISTGGGHSGWSNSGSSGW